MNSFMCVCEDAYTHSFLNHSIHAAALPLFACCFLSPATRGFKAIVWFSFSSYAVIHWANLLLYDICSSLAIITKNNDINIVSRNHRESSITFLNSPLLDLDVCVCMVKLWMHTDMTRRRRCWCSLLQKCIGVPPCRAFVHMGHPSVTHAK